MEQAEDIYAPGRTFICSECKADKPLSGFYLQKKGRVRPFTKCKECNKKRIRGYEAKLAVDCPGLLSRWRDNGKESLRRSIAKYKKARRANGRPPCEVIRDCLRRRMCQVLKRGSGSATSLSIELLGCPVSDARAHLEAQFQPGMSWQNHGPNGWHIDHIRPCASFDLTDPEQQRQCFHYSNLQPLWAADNLRKGARY